MIISLNGVLQNEITENTFINRWCKCERESPNEIIAAMANLNLLQA